jgi:hypothetical protein
VPKNNLGRDDLPSIRFTIEGTLVRTDDGGVSDVGRVVIGQETGTTIREAMERHGDDDEVRTQIAEAKEWLAEYLSEHSHSDSRDVKRAAVAVGLSESTLKRARKALRVIVTNLSESPRRTVWSLPISPVGSHARENDLTGLTGLNAGQSVVTDLGEPSIGASWAGGTMPPREVTHRSPQPSAKYLPIRPP